MGWVRMGNRSKRPNPGGFTESSVEDASAGDEARASDNSGHSNRVRDTLKTPDQWATQLIGPARHIYQAADILYGWRRWRYDYVSKPFLITQSVFEAAILAAGTYPAAPLDERAFAK